jgi:hypothetical protein
MKNPSKEPADICIKALDRFLDKKLIYNTIWKEKTLTA